MRHELPAEARCAVGLDPARRGWPSVDPELGLSEEDLESTLVWARGRARSLAATVDDAQPRSLVRPTPRHRAAHALVPVAISEVEGAAPGPWLVEPVVVEVVGLPERTVLHTREIGIDRVVLDTSRPVGAGTRLRLQMLSPEGRGTFCFMGRVDAFEPDGGRPGGLAVEITTRAESTRDALAQVIARARRWATAGAPARTLGGRGRAPGRDPDDRERLSKLRRSLVEMMDPPSLEFMVQRSGADPAQVRAAFERLSEQSIAIEASGDATPELRAMAAECCLRIEHAYLRACALTLRESSMGLDTGSTAALSDDEQTLVRLGAASDRPASAARGRAGVPRGSLRGHARPRVSRRGAG